MTFPRAKPAVNWGMAFRFLMIHSFLGLYSISAETFTVVTYNVENYFLTAFANRKAKTEPSRTKVVDAITAIKPDILALQEMGRKEALQKGVALLSGDFFGRRWPSDSSWRPQSLSDRGEPF